MIIHNKENGSRIVWNPETDAPLLMFNGGVFETKDSKVSETAKKLGYVVEGEEAAVEESAEEEKPKTARSRKKKEE